MVKKYLPNGFFMILSKPLNETERLAMYSIINPRTEAQRANELSDLYTRMVGYLGLRDTQFPYARFLQWVNQYNRSSRLFHGIDHLLDVTKEDPNLSAKANVHKIIGMFFHDGEYPSIGEEVTEVSRRYLDKHIRVDGGKHYIKSDVDLTDPVTKILLQTFGFKAGQELSAFGGMNEFYSAVAAAEEMRRLGCDVRDILGVVAVIQGTIAFGKGSSIEDITSRFDGLRSRIEGLNEELNLGLYPIDIDDIMKATVKAANIDVSGFLGGLDPMKPGVKPTPESVLATIAGGDRLRPEECPKLRLEGLPESERHYPIREFLNARMKGAGLYIAIIPGDTDGRTIPNLFHATTLSDGSIFPPADEVHASNRVAYENNLPVRVAECARLISSAAIMTIARSTGLEELKPDNISLQDLVEGTEGRLKAPKLQDASNETKLAYTCLNGRHGVGYDIRQSPIALQVLAEIGFEKVWELGIKVRDLLNPQNLKLDDILPLLAAEIPKTMLIAREQIELSLSQGEKADKTALATAVRGVDIPTAQSPS